MRPPSRSRRWSSIGELVGVRSRPWAGRKSSKRCGLCSLYPCPDYLAVLAAESLVKGMTELAVPGVDQEPERLPTCLPSQGQRSTSAACPWHTVAARSARTDARRQERRSDTVVRRAQHLEHAAVLDYALAQKPPSALSVRSSSPSPTMPRRAARGMSEKH